MKKASKSPNKKILIIFLDGASWTVIRPAIDEGYMPYLKRLMVTGAWGILKSTYPPITPAAFASFQTGLNPGQTGVTGFAFWNKKENRQELADSTSLPKTIWEYASEAGKTVGVVDLPMTYPPRKVSGCIVAGELLAPSLESDFVYPSSLKGEILKAVPEYKLIGFERYGKHDPHSQLDQFLKEMISLTKARVKIAHFLFQKFKFDIFTLQFQVLDIVQHPLWGYLDKTNPLYDPKKRKKILSKFYRFLDEETKKVCKEFSKNIGSKNFLTLVVSDHGFQSHLKRVNLARLFWENKLLFITPEKQFKLFLISKLTKIDKRLKRKLVKLGQRSKLMGRLTGAKSFTEFFDWQKSLALPIGTASWGLVYVLKKRRETTKNIIRILENLKDPETGKKVVKKIYGKEKLYGNNLAENVPDLIIEPIDGYSLEGSRNPGDALFNKITIEDFHIGTHHQDGIIIASRPIRGKKKVRLNIENLASLILSEAGVNKR